MTELTITKSDLQKALVEWLDEVEDYVMEPDEASEQLWEKLKEIAD